MKKSIKKFENQKVNNPNAIKGGGRGSGTKKSATRSRSRAELQ